MKQDPKSPVIPSAWNSLRRFTQARIALGRAGTSLPTRAHLEFQLDHARARDAVHRALDVTALGAELKAEGLATTVVHSAAGSRGVYLQRPDLGRRLDAPSRERLKELAAQGGAGFDVVIAIVDGLSAFAIEKNTRPFLKALLPRLRSEGLCVGPMIIAEQGRVALGDEIGEALDAALAVVLIGERPGLSSPDSLGVYMTWAPRVGRTNADRNYISNIRPEGLSAEAGANKLLYLISEATRRGLSGVLLKDETGMDGATLLAESPSALSRDEATRREDPSS